MSGKVIPVWSGKPLSVYLAGPFFSPKQVEFVNNIVAMFDSMSNLKYYSPLHHGGNLKDLLKAASSRREKEEILNKVDDDNLDQIMKSDLLVVIIDDRDPGTMIETGMARVLNKMIITTTASDYDVNVMISQYSICHTKSLNQLQQVLTEIQKLNEEYGGDGFWHSTLSGITQISDSSKAKKLFSNLRENFLKLGLHSPPTNIF